MTNTQYLFPADQAEPAPSIDDLRALTDEALEVYRLPDARRLVVAAACALDDAVEWGIDITPYVGELVTRARRYRALDGELGRRIDDRLARQLAGLDR